MTGLLGEGAAGAKGVRKAVFARTARNVESLTNLATVDRANDRRQGVTHERDVWAKPAAGDKEQYPRNGIEQKHVEKSADLRALQRLSESNRWCQPSRARGGKIATNVEQIVGKFGFAWEPAAC